jgi:murein DD-endopeptidase MepM/ murein hydrolase activator NlpD
MEMMVFHQLCSSLCLLLLVLAGPAFADPVQVSAPDEWSTLQGAVRDGKIPRSEARKEIVRLGGLLREGAGAKGVSSPFHFPVKGYGPDSIGGKAGSGFKPSGYDFYDGNRHIGHPAHDLFIRDSRSDGLDSGTGKPAEIVSFTDGVVIAVNPSWQFPSEIRGGIYLWIYDPAGDRYYYYAHLAQALVVPGDRVRAGERIALLGRTGKNAWSKRSPTHLHFMCLSFDDGRMTPHDTYHELLGAVVSGQGVSR